MNQFDAIVREASEAVVNRWMAGTSDLTTETVKEAQSRGMDGLQAHKLVHFVNVRAHTRKFAEATGDDRYVTFDVCDPDIVVASVGGGAAADPLAPAAAKVASYAPVEAGRYDAEMDYEAPLPRGRPKFASITKEAAVADLAVLFGEDVISEAIQKVAYTVDAHGRRNDPRDADVLQRDLDDLDFAERQLKEAATDELVGYDEALSKLAEAIRTESVSTDDVSKALYVRHAKLGHVLVADLCAKLPGDYIAPLRKYAAARPGYTIPFAHMELVDAAASQLDATLQKLAELEELRGNIARVRAQWRG